MTDILNKEDVIIFVNVFYKKVRIDMVLGPVFAAVIINDNWEPHLNRMYSFWNTVLFGKRDYQGNPFSKHTNLPITKIHFQHWIDLLNETIDENFEGDKADEVKMRADKMRILFQSKLEYVRAHSQ
ncbi:MAG: hemoglobin, partial [Saprospiraceae bacterium]